MWRRLFHPRSERHACQVMGGALVTALLGIIAIKMVLWWGWSAMLSG